MLVYPHKETTFLTSGDYVTLDRSFDESTYVALFLDATLSDIARSVHAADLYPLTKCKNREAWWTVFEMACSHEYDCCGCMHSILWTFEETSLGILVTKKVAYNA